jgi:hypothetical protein
MFMVAFLHGVRHDYYASGDPIVNGRPSSGSFSLRGTARWNGQCGSTDYVMGRPLVQAFHKSIWDPVWPGESEANANMAEALSYALAMNRGHQIDDMARDIIDFVQRTQTSAIRNRITDIFQAHGFASIGDACAVNITCSGPRTSRCDQTVVPRLCIPDDGWGRRGEYCTHNRQCDARRGLVCRVRSGPAPQPGTCQP